MAAFAAVQSELFVAGAEDDAWGAAHCQQLPADERRRQGITLTPTWLVDLMLDRVAQAGHFDTLVDPGAGSGRFCIAAAKRFPAARILAVERSDAMTDVLERTLRAEGLEGRVEVIRSDFRDAPLVLAGRTAFVGNPPFVRHHDIEPVWKQWYAQRMERLGQSASQLAGLHLHFLARAAELMRAGDHLCIVTSAEWLDNGYGSAWRQLLSRDTAALQLRGLWVADPKAPVFPEALVSAVVFEAAHSSGRQKVEVGQLAKTGLQTVRALTHDELHAEGRWTPLCQQDLAIPTSGIDLGELFKVTRGQVTGLNEAWVLPMASDALPPGLTMAAVTRAREIIDGTVDAPDALTRLRRVVSLPADLSGLADATRARVDRFLAVARARGAADGYVAKQRRAWHALDLRAPPAAMVSYMGRRPPVFRANPHAVSYLNIAHGLYPRQPVSADTLASILSFLNTTTTMGAGRMYGGGLAKFEPSDISRLRVPVSVLEGQP